MAPDRGDLVVRGGQVVTAHGFIEQGAVVIKDGVIAWVGRAAEMPAQVGGEPVAALPALDATGCIVAPGLLDVHTHGGGGADVMDATVDALQTMARAHARHGTTGFLAAAVTAAQDSLEEVAQAVVAGMRASEEPEWGGARVLGLHLEGPYFNAAKRGAQDPAFMRPPAQAELERIMAIAGAGFRHITLAPELPGALDTIRWLRQRGVRVALGHTEASYETTLAAIEAGADHATHVYNGMPPLHHRQPGILGAVLGHDSVTAELIADGIHVHPGAMRLLIKAKGPQLTCLITDSIAAMDMPDGRYQLGSMAVVLKDGACRLADGDSLAGSVLTLDRAVKNVVEMVGVPLLEAIGMATSVPARQMGLSHRKGEIAVGKDGDLCLFGSDLLCRYTVLAGRVIHRAPF